MADILILGMEMPKDGVYWCEIGIAGEIATITIHGEDRKSFPLLPLQEGHGRCIDADAMERTMSDIVQGDIRVYPYSDTLWDMAFRWIDHQPTIAPAEGGNDDGSKL